MNNIAFRVFYPRVIRDFPNPSHEQREFANFVKTDLLEEEVCQLIFAGMNGGSGQEFPWFVDTRARSMSVGDVIYFPFTNAWFLCDSCGWMELTQEQFNEWMDYPRKYGCCGFEVSEWKDGSVTLLEEKK